MLSVNVSHVMVMDRSGVRRGDGVRGQENKVNVEISMERGKRKVEGWMDRLKRSLCRSYKLMHSNAHNINSSWLTWNSANPMKGKSWLCERLWSRRKGLQTKA